MLNTNIGVHGVLFPLFIYCFIFRKVQKVFNLQILDLMSVHNMYCITRTLYNVCVHVYTLPIATQDTQNTQKT